MLRNQKKMIIFLYDLLVYLGAFVVSYNFLNPLIIMTYREVIFFAVGTFLLYYLIAQPFNLYKKIVRYTSISDTLLLSLAVGASFIISTSISYLIGFSTSMRFMFLAWVISWVLIVGGRVIWRIAQEHLLKRQRLSNMNELGYKIERTLVVGGGAGGALFIRRLINDPSIHFVGIVDDDNSKQNTYIHSIPFLGKSDDLPTLIQQFNVDQVTIAIPSLDSQRLNQIVESISHLEVKINQMPSIEDFLTGKYTINKFKEIDVVDLLGREEVKLDMEIIGSKTTGQTILVSGAGGSIGSEICRQLLRFKPKKLILLDQAELPIYKIHRELIQRVQSETEFVQVIANIQDRKRLDEVMAKYQPDRIYHAAAHKHVPLMEANPREAVKNNIYGTKNLAESAKAYNVRSFVMISTDKAVNPPNVMGATKRIAEMIVTGLNEVGKTKFVAVRFGNVLNSSGSVIPVFKEQLRNGGPLTVTDYRMTRYFMTIPEASRLVLQAGALAEGGEIFVLDMGEPVKIVDLAKKIIQLSGFTVEEIGITEIGIRPGEKLFEEILTSSEAVKEQVYEKIFVGKVTQKPLSEVMNFVHDLDQLNEQELAKSLVNFANN